MRQKPAIESSRASVCFAAGEAFLKRRQIECAIRCFHQAQQLGYSANECAGARWHCWMLSGCFDKAWEESDFIAAGGTRDPQQLWNGKSWAGKRVVLRCLHGLGDTIQFIRYAPRISSQARSLVVQVHPQLVTLIKGVAGIKRVYTWTQTSEPQPADWDMQMEVTELPRAFRTMLDTVPADVPYIQVPLRRHAWAREIVGERRGFRVGLAWECGPWNPSRSIPLNALDSIFRVPRVHFYALQKGFEPDATCNPGLHNPERHSTDVRDTAALMQQMDLMITTDTMSAHLAGALGLPVWILLPFEADWRWMLDRDDSPWYPTARLFRQVRPGDWDPVARDIAERLSRLPG